MKHISICNIFLTTIVGYSFLLEARSVHRPTRNDNPTVTIGWADTNDHLTYTHSHFTEYPLFSFDAQDFNSHLISHHTTLSFRNNPAECVSTTLLDEQIQTLIKEIGQHKSTFSHFNVLQYKNFNSTHQCGLLVLQFKEYPFVLKLFMERPETFFNPHCKGVEPISFFYMAGGGNRHLSGFTRIKNLEYLKKKISTLDRWKGCVEFPRKWFWIPNHSRWIAIKGKNFSTNQILSTTIPSTYAIIADLMDVKDTASITRKQKRKAIMRFCNDVTLFVDPHPANFSFKKCDSKKGWKMVIVDTEHFPTMCGIKKHTKLDDHLSYYLYLSSKCFADTWLYTRDQRRQALFECDELRLPKTTVSV